MLRAGAHRGLRRRPHGGPASPTKKAVKAGARKAAGDDDRAWVAAGTTAAKATMVGGACATASAGELGPCSRLAVEGGREEDGHNIMKKKKKKKKWKKKWRR